LERFDSSSSLTPAAKNAFSFSSLRFSSGRTAMLFSGGKLVAAIFPFAQRIFSIVRGRDIRGRFLKKFEVLENLASQFPKKRMEGKGH